MNEPKLYGLLIEWNGEPYQVTGFNNLKEEYSLTHTETRESVFVSFDELESEAIEIGGNEQ